MVNVTWHQASAYCAWAGARLPTQEEWEHAARGPYCTKYPWGDSPIDPTRSNYEESGIDHPTPTGLYPAGASLEGVFDMIGNVWELTASEYEPEPGTYAWRGGSFSSNHGSVRASSRLNDVPQALESYLGFRMAASIP